MIKRKPRGAVFLSAKAPALRTDATPLTCDLPRNVTLKVIKSNFTSVFPKVS